jgi:hypothetical protein
MKTITDIEGFFAKAQAEAQKHLIRARALAVCFALTHLLFGAALLLAAAYVAIPGWHIIAMAVLRGFLLGCMIAQGWAAYATLCAHWRKELAFTRFLSQVKETTRMAEHFGALVQFREDDEGNLHVAVPVPAPPPPEEGDEEPRSIWGSHIKH